MNWNISEINWIHLKRKVKSQWSKLTEDNLDAIAGQRASLSGKIQEIYDITEVQAEKQIRRFEKTNKDEKQASLF